MPRYFVDTTDQEFFCRDDDGAEFASLNAAKAAAVGALRDMAHDELPDGDARTFLAIIRDEGGRPVLQAGLSLHVASLLPKAERGDWA